METLIEILNSENIGKLSIIAIIILLLLGYAVQKGWIKGKVKNFVIGNDDERKIIREQMMYAKAELDVYFSDLIQNNKSENFDKIRCLYCKELVFDIIVSCIALNHITTDELYIEGVIQRVWADLSKVKVNDRFLTQDFRIEQKKEIDKIIKKLVEIRTYYQKRR